MDDKHKHTPGMAMPDKKTAPPQDKENAPEKGKPAPTESAKKPAVKPAAKPEKLPASWSMSSPRVTGRRVRLAASVSMTASIPSGWSTS